ncbi:hypothetical protein BDV41DRAFT_414801 [Aspergillus transmontanensis]|uniref:Uncharacterized protein n=1 Tax=Aspergillus transmontanensis TaxID=1034304 RepID=A0A5N6WBM0_9EURO|nr:hypothetical protein BDV41DRAFT_414801 [Aspergillus transmontanensis]
MQILPTPPSPTESATGAIDPKWHLAYSGFGLLGLIILAAFGTFFAMVYLRAKQMYVLSMSGCI